MDAVFGVADPVLVLIDGVLVADGTPMPSLRPAVRERYLGHGWDLQEHLREGPPDSLSLRDVRMPGRSAAQALVGVNLRVRPQRAGGAARSERCRQVHTFATIMGIGPRVRGFVGYQKIQDVWFASYLARASGAGALWLKTADCLPP